MKHSCSQRLPLSHRFEYQGEGKIDVKAPLSEGKRVEGEIEGQCIETSSWGQIEQWSPRFGGQTYFTPKADDVIGKVTSKLPKGKVWVGSFECQLTIILGLSLSLRFAQVNELIPLPQILSKSSRLHIPRFPRGAIVNP